MFSISSLAVTALNPWENDGYWLCFTAAFEMAVKPLFSKTLLLIPPSAWWYCCCDDFRLGVRWGGRNSLCQTGCLSWGEWGKHWSQESWGGTRWQTLSWAQLNTTWPFRVYLALINLLHKGTGCLQGRAHAAGSWGRNSSALWGCGGVLSRLNSEVGPEGCVPQSQQGCWVCDSSYLALEFLVPSCRFALIWISIKKSWI